MSAAMPCPPPVDIKRKDEAAIRYECDVGECKELMNTNDCMHLSRHCNRHNIHLAVHAPFNIHNPFTHTPGPSEIRPKFWFHVLANALGPA